MIMNWDHQWIILLKTELCYGTHRDGHFISRGLLLSILNKEVSGFRVQVSKHRTED